MNAVGSEGTILAGCFDNVAWIRVEGKGSALNSARLKDFARMSRSRGQRNFVIDLENCPAMDSTFMGTLAAMALDLKGGEPQGSVQIINLNERNRSSLLNLGLSCLLEVDLEGTSWQRERTEVARNLTKPLAPVDLDQRQRAAMVMEAHEALVQANADNFSQFRDVIEILRDEIAEGKGD